MPPRAKDRWQIPHARSGDALPPSGAVISEIQYSTNGYWAGSLQTCSARGDHVRD